MSNGLADFGWATTEVALPDGSQLIVVPPQAISILPDGPLRGLVAKSAFASGQYTIEFGIGTATLSATNPHRFAPGDSISFRIEPQKVLAVDG